MEAISAVATSVVVGIAILFHVEKWRLVWSKRCVTARVNGLYAFAILVFVASFDYFGEMIFNKDKISREE